MTIIINYQQLFLNYMHAHRYMCTHTHTHIYDIKTYAHWVTHKYNLISHSVLLPHSLVHTHFLLFPSMARINPETTKSKTLKKHQCTHFTGNWRDGLHTIHRSDAPVKCVHCCRGTAELLLAVFITAQSWTHYSFKPYCTGLWSSIGHSISKKINHILTYLSRLLMSWMIYQYHCISTSRVLLLVLALAASKRPPPKKNNNNIYNI